jgi:putative PIG3 family NAD(P)H quinone oxidoreductase
MRAVTITEPGGPEVLKLEQHDVPEPGPGQIRVRVRASALNRADILQRQGIYPPPPGAPAEIPGLEYAGEVDALGPGAGLWAVGNRVMGIVGGGGHAEYVVIHEREAVRIPQNLPWEEAAAVPEVFMTAYDALMRQAGLRADERVLIYAVGSGVGLAALQLARAMGATVLGTSRTPEKLRRAAEWGLETGLDAAPAQLPDAVREATAGEDIHVVLDLVGGPYFEAALQLVGSSGRIVLVGLMAGSRVEIDLGTLLRKRIRVFGTVLRSRPLLEKIQLAREFSQNVLPLLTSGKIRPVIDRVVPFSEIAEAQKAMEANQTFGKVVLRW